MWICLFDFFLVFDMICPIIKIDIDLFSTMWQKNINKIVKLNIIGINN